MEARSPPVDAMDGPGVMYQAAGIPVEAGQFDRAVEVLTAFFAGPGEETIQFLKLDPAFDELRAHPGDQELVAGR